MLQLDHDYYDEGFEGGDWEPVANDETLGLPAPPLDLESLQESMV